MECVSLFSGSGGNSIFVKSENTRILVDAGVSFRRICLALSGLHEQIEELDGIFFTHEHSDHIGALPMLLKKTSLPFYLAAASAEAAYETLLAKDPSLAAEFVLRTFTVEPGEEYELGALAFSPFSLPHDSAACLGAVFYAPDGKKALGIATDLGEATVEARRALYGCPALILESNHDPVMLKNGPYPPYLQARIASEFGHLSNPDCASLCSVLAPGGLRRVLLFHLSAENNSPRKALEETRRALAATEAEITVQTASPDCPCILL